MSRKNLTRRIAALALAAALALPAAALARPGRHAGASPWGPLWTWMMSWIVGVRGVETPASPVAAHPVTGSWAKAGATIDPDGRKGTLLETYPPVPATPLPSPSGGN